MMRRPRSAEARPPDRPNTVRIPLAVTPAPRRALNAGIVFAAGFAAIIAAGTVLLMLPASRRSGEWTAPLEAAFTAVSAVCVTGLVVVDTATHWSTFGQVIVLGLMQVGGLGFMLFSTLILRLAGRRASLRERLLVRDALGGGALGSVAVLVRRVLLYTVVVEGVGAVLLTIAFAAYHPLPTALWWGVFHAISAFNNAGFDLTGNFQSLVPFQDAPLILLTIGVLLLLGSLSYVVVEDVLRHRRFQRLSLDSKLVLVVSFVLLPAGALLLLFTERANSSTFVPLPADLQVLNAFFLSVVRTAGFSSIDTASMTDGSLLVLTGLMMIGGAAGSMAGGIKVQTVGILVCATVSAIRGLPDVVAFERRVPMPEVLRAIAVTMMSGALVFLATFLLGLTDTQPFLRELFEVVSAFATVGLSTGLSSETGVGGRVILMVLMFVGRLGPLTLAVALAERQHGSPLRWPTETVRIG